jgi:hypothetical protein
MKTLIIANLILFPVLTHACGFWIFKDLEAKKDYRALVMSFENIPTEKNTMSSRFLMPTDKTASVENGDIINYHKEEITYFKHGPLGRKNEKQKNTKTIGRFVNDTIIIDNYGEFKLAVTNENNYQKITVTNKDGVIVGTGDLTSECTKEAEYQKRRLIGFYAWKSLKIPPLYKRGAYRK